jgi:tetratricopeptide (TPR) repeat protein
VIRASNLQPYSLICWLCAAWLAALPDLAFASQTIYLKNGHRIVADSAQMDSKAVTYDLGGNEFTIPRSLVDHIGPAQSGNAESPVIHNGEVDDGYIEKLNAAFDSNPSPENRHNLASAYEQAAIFLLRQGHADASIEKYREALTRISGDPTLETGLGYLLIKQNHPWQAIEVLLPAQDQHPRVADIPLLLGSAYYAMEDLNQAVIEWQKALTLHDDSRIRAAVAQAERERRISGSYQVLDTQHFVLLFDEDTVKDLANQMIPVLEDDFQSLERDLDYFPQDTIHVILYPKQAFRDVTRSPQWAGAVNDGKIRVPVSGLSAITPDLARVLKHELTHSFVHQETLDRCPAWFNEGIAQMEDGSTLSSVARSLPAPWQRVKRPPLPPCKRHS